MRLTAEYSVLYLPLMKRINRFVPLLALAFFAVATPVWACPWWQFPCPTNTPTPTPTPVLIQKIINPNLFKNIGPLSTVSPTTAPTLTVTPTLTITPSISPTTTLSATETPSVVASGTPTVAPTVEATPAVGQTTTVSGFTKKDVLFGVLVVVLLILIIVQGNWGKIKTWLHKKTE